MSLVLNWCTFSDELMAKGIVQYEKTLKKVRYWQGISLLQGQIINGNSAEKVFWESRPSCCATKMLEAVVYLFPSSLIISSFIYRALVIINPIEFSQNSKISLFLPALNLGVWFSSLLTNTFCGFSLFIFSRIGHFYMHYKPVETYFFTSMIFLMLSGNLFTNT